jgi:hypothetical protein
MKQVIWIFLILFISCEKSNAVTEIELLTYYNNANYFETFLLNKIK